MAVHERMAATLDEVVAEIARIRARAREQLDAGHAVARPRWPVIVLRTPKGWTGPGEVDGVRIEGRWRAHQVPLGEVRTNDAHRAQLEGWLRSYRPEELFDGDGRFVPELRALAPTGSRRMSATPHANGGELLRDLRMPDFTAHAVDVPKPGTGPVSATGTAGKWLADVIAANPENFRLFGPDETASNRLSSVFAVTDRQFVGELAPTDEHVAPSGRVVEVRSEHLCQGWLEGYLLTGRHGLFTCYEAFIHIVDSMFNQHAKWLDASRDIPWRRPIASLTYLLTIRLAPGPQRVLPPASCAATCPSSRCGWSTSSTSCGCRTPASTRTGCRTPNSTGSSPPTGPEPRQHPRARLQRGRHHHDSVRHGDVERPGPLPPRDRRDRPGSGAGRAPRGAAAAHDRRAAALPAAHPRVRRRRPRGRPARHAVINERGGKLQGCTSTGGWPEAMCSARWRTAARHCGGTRANRPSCTAARASPATSEGSSPTGDIAVRTRAGHSTVTPIGLSASASAACSAIATTACLDAP
jgi:hypothetical protein